MSTKFEHVINEHQSLLSRVASTYEHNDALQQELLQEIAIAVWQALPKFEQQASLKTYILKIAHNRAVSHVSKEVRQPTNQVNDEEFEVIDSASSPEHETRQQQQLTQLLKAIRTLPIKTRQIVTLSLEGLSYQEISDITGMSINQIGVTLNRVKKQLNRMLQHD